MEIIKCKNGHSYDPSVTPECPECARLRAIEGTVPLDPAEGSAWPQGNGGADKIEKTQPVYVLGGAEKGGYQPTEPVERPRKDSWFEQDSYQKAADGNPWGRTEQKSAEAISPVVGWLVCTKGPTKGQDFKIHADNNYIGRAPYMDIAITGDDTISRENHAILAYDTREKLYYFAPGSGRGIVRLNGKAVLMMTELHAYDKIEIGRSILIFVPLCGEQFSWEELEDDR